MKIMESFLLLSLLFLPPLLSLSCSLSLSISPCSHFSPGGRLDYEVHFQLLHDKSRTGKNIDLEIKHQQHLKFSAIINELICH